MIDLVPIRVMAKYAEYLVCMHDYHNAREIIEECLYALCATCDESEVVDRMFTKMHIMRIYDRLTGVHTHDVHDDE